MRRILPAILFLSTAVAAAADPGPVSLSLAEASRQALTHNTSLLIERESLSQADFAITGARGAYDLSWNAEARYRDNTDPVNSIFSGAPEGQLAPVTKGVNASTSLTQLLPTGGSVSLFTSWGRGTTNNIFTILSPAYTTGFGITLRQPLLQNLSIDPAREAIRIASAEHGASEARLRRVVADILTQVDATYWNLVAARRNVASIGSSIALADQQLSETKSRVEAGVLGETDIAQPVAELERRKGNLALARQRVAEAENTLKRLMLGGSSDALWSEEIVPTDDPDAQIEQPELSEALSTAQSRRPEIAEVKAQRTVSEVQVDARKSDVLPRLDLVAGYQRRGLAGSQNSDAVSFDGGPIVVPPQILGATGRSYGTIFDNEFPDASVGLAFTLPIGNRTAKANLAIARSQLQQANLDLTATQQRVEAEVRNAAFALETAHQRIGAARAARAAAETQLYAEQERFQVGLSTNFLVLTRQNELTQARVTETDALTDYRKASTELSRSTGTLLERRHITLDTDSTTPAKHGGSR
jgi:outer membrane protein TolC